MKELVVDEVRTLAECDALLGTRMKSLDQNDRRVSETCRMVTRSGELVGVLLKRAIPMPDAVAAFRVLNDFHGKSNNRGNASDKTKIGKRMKNDGTRGNTTISLEPKIPENGIIGYFDRSVRMPFCRQTAFTRDKFQAFRQLYPFFTSISELYREHVPLRWQAQRETWERTSPDFRIEESVFTTVTVNKNFQTAIHQDVGDLKEGFSCLAVLRKGVYSGGEFMIPRYGVALEMDSCDVALIDPHAHHGNLPIVKLTAGAERISAVLYYRTRMQDCLSMAEELKRVQARREGDALHDDPPAIAENAK